jgi:hypothetical protein
MLDTFINELKMKLLDVEIDRNFGRAERARRELYSLHLFLLNNVHEIIWREFEESVFQIGRYKSMKKRRIQNSKLNRLGLTKFVGKQKESEKNFVINKSTKEFTNDQMRLLNKGLKYKPKPLQCPVNEIVVAIESSIKFIPFEEKVSVREKVTKVIDKHQEPVTSNKVEWKVIKELKNSDCVFLNPDKGKGIVIMDKKDYVEAGKKLLDNDNYEIVKSKRKFPVDVLQKQVKDELKSLKDEGLLNGHEVRKLTVSNPVIPSFSCLPKIHKEGNKNHESEMARIRRNDIQSERRLVHW